MVNFGSALERAWKYSTNLKRVGVFTLFLIISLSIVLLPLLFAYNGALPSMSQLSRMQFFVWLAVGIAVALLVYMYAVLLFTHNYANQKSLGNSAKYAKSRYLRFLGAMIVTCVISGVVSMVPFIGIVLSIIVGFILFFVPQEIAVGGGGISKSLTNSYNLFKKNIVDVVITLIVSAILSIIIMLIFAIPIFIVGFMDVVSAMSTGNFMHVFLSNAPLFVVTGLILLVGMALAILFSNSIRTDIYMQLKKRRK